MVDSPEIGQPPSYATARHSVGMSAFKGALLMGSAMAGGTYLLGRQGTLMLGPLTERFAIFQGVFGALIGASQGASAASAHNSTAQIIDEFQAMQKDGALLPENMPVIPDKALRHQNVLQSALTSGLGGALIWGAFSAIFDGAMRPGGFSFDNMNKRQLLGNAALGFLLDAPDGYYKAHKQNERADVLGYYTRKAQANARAHGVSDIVEAGPTATHQAALASLLQGSTEHDR